MNPSDLMDTAAVRKHCGGVSRPTMLRWRQNGFPAPLRAPDVTVELWDRADVEEWWKGYEGRAKPKRKRRKRA